MNKFAVFFYIILRTQVLQWSTLSSTLFFYCCNFVLINFVIDVHESTIIIQAFLLFILNFTSAFVIKNSYIEDHTSMRLYYFGRKSLTLLYFLLAKISAFTVYIFIVQIIFYPWILLFFKCIHQNDSPYIVFWFLLSAFYLSLHYLLAESFSLNNRSNSFMSFVIVMPLLVPWFIFSVAFIFYNQIQALGIIFGLILLSAPCLIGAQYWLIKHGLKLS